MTRYEDLLRGTENAKGGFRIESSGHSVASLFSRQYWLNSFNSVPFTLYAGEMYDIQSTGIPFQFLDAKGEDPYGPINSIQALIKLDEEPCLINPKLVCADGSSKELKGRYPLSPVPGMQIFNNDGSIVFEIPPEPTTTE